MEHKLQPQALDLEQSVLGALMLESKAVPVVLQILTSDSFYDPKHVEVFNAIQTLHQKGTPVDILTVTRQLRQSGSKVTATYVANLTDKIASAANVEAHSLIIQQKYIQRQIIRNSTEIIQDAYSELTDPFELVDKLQSMSVQIARSIHGNKTVTLEQAVIDAQKRITELYDKPELLSGVPLGFPSLDRFTGGWQNGELTIMAGRPGMGKTGLAVKFARNAAKLGYNVGFFSLEMTATQLAQREIQGDAEINSHDLRNPAHKLDKESLKKACDVTGEPNVFIDDRGGLTIGQIAAQATIWKQEHDIKLILIDYLQLIKAGSMGKDIVNAAQKYSMISRELKNLSKRLDVPVIALSQLNRGVESRSDKRPVLSDLKESGGIEENSDAVILLYRPEYYGFTSDADGNDLTGLIELNWAKHRNGAVDVNYLRFIDRYVKFEERENEHFEPNHTKLMADARSRAANDLPF